MLIFINDIKKRIFDCIQKNKFFSFLIISTFFIGIIIAIITLIGCKEIITIKNLIDKPLLLYLKQDIGLFSFFIRRFFLLLLVGLLFVVLSANKFTKYLNLLVVIYLSYLIVFNMGVIIICFGFFGVLYSIFLTLLFGIIYLFILSILCLISYECSCQLGDFLKNLKGQIYILLTLLIVLLILCFLEMLILPLFTSTFIIHYL